MPVSNAIVGIDLADEIQTVVVRWRARRHDRAPDLPTNGVDATVLATAAGSVISPSMVLPAPP